jgi:Domain of unknown function (DUF151)
MPARPPAQAAPEVVGGPAPRRDLPLDHPGRPDLRHRTHPLPHLTRRGSRLLGRQVHGRVATLVFRSAARPGSGRFGGTGKTPVLHHAHRDRRRPADVDRRRQGRGDGPCPQPQPRRIPRPQTYQFTAALLAASGGRLREVRITSLTDDVFYAQAVLASGTVVDARPSDAVNFAAVSDAPVYVAAGLLERFAQDVGGFFDAPAR